MKNKIVAVFLLSAASSLVFADKTPAGADPTAPYHEYGPAMAHKDGHSMAVEWHDENGAELEPAVDAGTLADLVADKDAATAFLQQVKGAYETDPMVAIQMAAVSQWVMGEEPCWLCFWKPSPSAGRKVWVDALLARAETSADAYVQMACLDQLRWCGCRCPEALARIRAIGAAGDKPVREMAALLLRELEGKAVGL